MSKRAWLALGLVVFCVAAGCSQLAPETASPETPTTDRQTTTTTERTDVPISTATTREHQPGDTSVLVSPVENASAIPERDITNVSAFTSSRQDVLVEAIDCTCAVETIQFDLGDIDARAVRYNGTLYRVYVRTV